MESLSDVLRAQGITLRVIGKWLRLSPKEKVTAEILDFAKAHKQKIIEELRRAEELRKKQNELFEAYQAMYRKISILYQGGKLPEGFEYELLLLDRKIDAQTPDSMYEIKALTDELQRIEN